MHQSSLANRFIGRIAQLVPYPLQLRLKRVGLFRFLFLFFGKEDAELVFQRDWAAEFAANQARVLEYWKQYRDLPAIVALCQLDSQSSVLDVGCGISTVLHFVPGRRFGIDPLADEYLKLYDYPKEVMVRKGSGEAIPFLDETFDVVFCCNVLDHVTSPDKTISEIHRVLKARAHFVLTVEIFDESTRRDPAHPHALTRTVIKTLLEGRFSMEREHEAPWIGLRVYVHGARTGENWELILVMQKRLEPLQPKVT